MATDIYSAEDAARRIVEKPWSFVEQQVAVAVADRYLAACTEVRVLQAQCGMAHRFASYCRSCALSGETDPMTFEAFVRMPVNCNDQEQPHVE